MKLLRVGSEGEEKPAVLDHLGHIRDLSDKISDINGHTLGPDLMEVITQTELSRLPLVQGFPRIGPCVAGVGKFICVGLNYTDHAEESGMDVPEQPVIFMKATSSICGPNDDIILPPGAEKTDWEVELGVVIGTRAKQVPVDAALSHVAGYTVVHDISERAFQLERGGQWVKGKSYDRFGPIGPWLVTADEVPDPGKLSLWLEVNGIRVQSGHTGNMIFSVAEIIAHVSTYMTLEPGDIISTGTPAGVGLGFHPPQFLKAGDTVSLGISNLGAQSQLFKAPECYH